MHRFRTRVRVFRAFSSARLKNEKKNARSEKTRKKTRVRKKRKKNARLKKMEKKRAFEKRKKTRVRKKREKKRAFEKRKKKNARSKKWKPHVYVGRFFERASKKWFFRTRVQFFKRAFEKTTFSNARLKKKKKNALFFLRASGFSNARFFFFFCAFFFFFSCARFPILDLRVFDFRTRVRNLCECLSQILSLKILLPLQRSSHPPRKKKYPCSLSFFPPTQRVRTEAFALSKSTPPSWVRRHNDADFFFSTFFFEVQKKAITNTAPYSPLSHKIIEFLQPNLHSKLLPLPNPPPPFSHFGDMSEILEFTFYFIKIKPPHSQSIFFIQGCR